MTLSMKRFVAVSIATLALMIVGVWNVAAKDHQTATTEILVKTTTSWDGALYESYPTGQPEVSLVRIIIPPNTQLAWHKHAMPNIGYIVRGELTVEEYGTGMKKRLAEGQALPEMVGTVHRGFSGPEAVELLVFYAGVVGMPLSEQVEGK